MPLHVSSTCAHHQEVKIALHSLWYHHTYRWPSPARDVLVTVHVIKFISVFNQIGAYNLFRNKFYFMHLHVSSTCAQHQEVKIALHSLWYHHTYRWPSRARDVLLTVHVSIFISVFNQLDAQNLFRNKYYFMHLHDSSACAYHQEVKIALHTLWYHHTYRCDDTRGCVMQF